MGKVDINKASGINPLKISELKKIDPLKIQELSNIDPLVISEIQHIAPAAVHIKELNHIDPLNIDSLRVNEVRNLDPIRVEKFNVTNLPTVNLSLRQLPAVDLNVRRLPPISVGLHQDFCLPSSYTLRARLLGIEFLRLNLDGHTKLSPRDKVRREQRRTAPQSFPEIATAGNPGIPSLTINKGSRVVSISGPSHHHSSPHCSQANPSHHATTYRGSPSPTVGQKGTKRQTMPGLLNVGHRPAQTFSMPPHSTRSESMGSSVSSGDS